MPLASSAGPSVFPEGLTLDEYIAELEKLRAVHGGRLYVQRWMPSTGRAAAPTPSLAFKRAYDAKRISEHKAPQFYNPDHDNPVQKGDPVIRV